MMDASHPSPTMSSNATDNGDITDFQRPSWVDQDPHDGEMETEMFPDDATEKQKRILKKAIIHRDWSISGVHEALKIEDGNDAPTMGYVSKTLSEFDVSLPPASAENAADREDVRKMLSDEDTTVSVSNGNASYSGPKEGIDATMTHLAEAPVHNGVEPEKTADDLSVRAPVRPDTEHTFGESATESMPLDEDDILDAVIALSRDDADRGTIKRFAQQL